VDDDEARSPHVEVGHREPYSPGIVAAHRNTHSLCQGKNRDLLARREGAADSDPILCSRWFSLENRAYTAARIAFPAPMHR
jgi:hypothetical protein